MVSFELSDEQREIRDWVHDFAEKEIRPVAVQYDESEEFPWPVVKKAAEVGLYGVDFLQQTYADATGIMPALVAEELTWGCAGIALAIQGTGRRRPGAARPRLRGSHPAARGLPAGPGRRTGLAALCLRQNRCARGACSDGLGLRRRFCGRRVRRRAYGPFNSDYRNHLVTATRPLKPPFPTV
jgi:hypothetical protein